MILFETVAAYEAAIKLCEHELAYEDAYTLAKLCAELKPHAEYYITEERKLAELCAKKSENGLAIIADGNRITFESAELREHFETKRAELAMVNFDLGHEPYKIKKPEMIRGAAILALEGFVEFV